jgi:hypothetical protein
MTTNQAADNVEKDADAYADVVSCNAPALAGHVKDIILVRQLWCCLERILSKLGLFQKYGVPDHGRPYVRSLRLSEDALSSLLEHEEAG